MPYIKKTRRSKIIKKTEKLLKYLSEEGDFNYAISLLMHGYIEQHGLRYKNLNAIMGVMDSASKEFYRTVVAPYEDKKMSENGAVSTLDWKPKNSLHD